MNVRCQAILIVNAGCQIKNLDNLGCWNNPLSWVFLLKVYNFLSLLLTVINQSQVILS